MCWCEFQKITCKWASNLYSSLNVDGRAGRTISLPLVLVSTGLFGSNGRNQFWYSLTTCHSHNKETLVVLMAVVVVVIKVVNERLMKTWRVGQEKEDVQSSDAAALTGWNKKQEKSIVFRIASCC